MKTVNWSFGYEKGAQNGPGNWSAGSLSPAFGKITRYWNVNFQQVTKRPDLQVILTNSSRGANVPMWQSGKNIYASCRYKWVNPDQMALAFVHEFGHWLVNGGGHIKQSGHVMSEILGDPHINFSELDMRWFGGLPWKSAKRPWDATEKNVFRIAKSVEPLDNEFPDVKMSCDKPVGVLRNLFGDFFGW